MTGANATIDIVGTVNLNYDSGRPADGLPNGQEGCCIAKNGKEGALIIRGTGTLNLNLSGYHASGIGNEYGRLMLSLTEAYRRANAGFYNLTIQGGVTVQGTAGSHAPVIGASCRSSIYDNAMSSNITIQGAGTRVIVQGGLNCAGLGSGNGVLVDGIYIKDGAYVEARGGERSPGIGSGGGGNNKDDYEYKFNVSNIEISGGNTRVVAYGDMATQTPGIGSGKGPNGIGGTITNVSAVPTEGYQGYVQYGTSDSSFYYSDSNPKTPFPATEEFGNYLQAQADLGTPVYFTLKHVNIAKNKMGYLLDSKKSYIRY